MSLEEKRAALQEAAAECMHGYLGIPVDVCMEKKYTSPGTTKFEVGALTYENEKEQLIEGKTGLRIGSRHGRDGYDHSHDDGYNAEYAQEVAAIKKCSEFLQAKGYDARITHHNDLDLEINGDADLEKVTQLLAEKGKELNAHLNAAESIAKEHLDLQDIEGDAYSLMRSIEAMRKKYANHPDADAAIDTEVAKIFEKVNLQFPGQETSGLQYKGPVVQNAPGVGRVRGGGGGNGGTATDT